MSVELRQLRYFIAVSEEGTVTGAARRLFVAQPAVSRQIRDLERHVGGRLFVRHASGVELTPEGTRLLPLARTLLEQADAIAGFCDPDRTARTGHREHFVIGLHDVGLGPLTAPLIAAFRASHPELNVRVQPVHLPDLYDCLTTGQVDALLTTTGANPDEAVFDALFADAMLATLPASSPLAEASTLTVDDVIGLPLVTHETLPAALTDPFILSRHRNNERAAVVDALPARHYADLLHQVAHLSAFMAVEASARLPFEGVAFVPLTDVDRVPAGIAVGRVAESRPAVESLRRLARYTAVQLHGLLPDARLLTG